jgi:cytoskeleton protein RodZ
MSLGAYLRSLREAKGGSLEDMARSTRVGIRHLEALEDERLADLPSPVFVRGFIRAYCSFLRENPEPALGRYHELAGIQAATQAANAPPRPRNTWASSSVVVGLVLLLILGLGLILVNLSIKKSGGTTVPTVRMEPPRPSAPAPSPPPPAPAPAPAPTAAPAPITPAPAASTPAAAPAPPPAPAATAEPSRPAAPPASAPAPSAPPAARPAAGTSPSAGQRLVIRAVEPTWVRVQTDEGRIAEELLPAGASREWAAERRFIVTIGNAGGVELTLNGKALPPLGPKGTVIQRLELPAPATTGS